MSRIDWDDAAVEKGGHAHFMHKEIFEQPEALQLLAYHVARLRGCPIDQPRNLAKSVTVE